MHRVIVPVDFSETSLNAARYTAQLLAGKEDALAILYTFYDGPDDLDVCINFQESLKREFRKAGVREVECIRESGGDLIDNISRLAHTLRATLIVMGITGKSAIRAALFGSNTLRLIDRNLYPVMIIPPDAGYKGLRNVLFATDLKEVEKCTPSALINAVLELFNPKLHLVHVTRDTMLRLPEPLAAEKEKLLALFSRFTTEFHLLHQTDFFRAMDQFIAEQNIDVIVTIPKHQSNATSIFKSTHTKRLAYHSQIPILAAHE